MKTKNLDIWLILIFLARTVMYANFMVYAACIPILIEKWEMSATQAGSISSAFMIGYAVSLFIFAWLSDYFGAKRLFLLSALLSSASALLFGFYAHSYMTGLILYGVAACTQGGLYTPAIMLFSERYEPSRRGTAVGYLIASTSVGYALSLVISGVCLSWGGYRAAFIVTGCLPLLGLVLSYLALRKTTNMIYPRMDGIKVRTILMRNLNARLLMAGYTFHCWELLGMWSWTPAFFTVCLAVSGDSIGQAAKLGAYLVATMHVIGALASASMGRMADYLGRRVVLIQVALIGAGLSFVIGWLSALPVWLLVAFGLIYYFSAIGDSPVLSTALTEAVEPNYLGAVLAVRSLLGFAAGGVSPIVFGIVLDLTNAPDTKPEIWGWAFMVLGIGGFAAFLCAYFYREPSKIS